MSTIRGGTIYALSTGRGRAGIAIVRVSGPGAAEAAKRLTGRAAPLPARVATPIHVFEGGEAGQGPLLDEALALWFQGPASYTGEDVLEFHVHGGRAVTEGVLAALAQCPDLRLAEPGEFTRRAFERGKLDLTEAEAVADLIDAETAAQRSQALRQMKGVLGDLYERWRQKLLGGLAHLEASIDFSDEELPSGIALQVAEAATVVKAEIAGHLRDGRRGEILREGVHIAIVGAANVGKSSLLNVIAKRDVAIVSAIAGTTRDVIEVHLDLGGYPAILADTAGLRESGDIVEQEGIRRTRARAEAADLKIAVFDAQAWPDAQTSALVDDTTMVVLNKVDLQAHNGQESFKNQPLYTTSVKTGEGIQSLLEALESRVAGLCGSTELPLITRARHREALQDCLSALERFLAGHEPELLAEDLRLATRALGRITGKVDVEDMLDIVFRDFCIGK
ncbi:MAG: tRNA uridine-5-carboxymethylaminomethyl(34) synthesis GTPase MnmE [Rhodospirillales bacterium]|nr:tRNA uridine-5-carboxymethylaminomethyl(34) synthesis GTPase MnmE [Rhodospirillales bacterium]